jgi:hypothetical protein
VAEHDNHPERRSCTVQLTAPAPPTAAPQE